MSGDIDLIPADNSSRNSECLEEGVGFSDEGKIKRAQKRLERLPSCGKEGHILAVFKGAEGRKDFELEVRYHPHRCHSVFCPYCAWENFKESYARVLPILEGLSVNGRLSFLTLTHRNTKVGSYQDVKRAIDEAFKGIQKLYQFRLFGKRNWKKIRSEFVREVLSYYRNAKEKLGVKEARRRAKRQIEFFRDFENRYWDYIGSDVKFGQLLNAVVKFELTYNAERQELHPHWHLIVADFRIPKLLMVVIWRKVSGSEIVDLRAVDDTKDATAELTKYITKGWEFPEPSEEEGGEEDLVRKNIRLWVEAEMLGRRKFRIWGFELLELEEEEKEEEYIGFWSMRAELKYRKNLHEIPRIVRRMRRKGIKEARIDRVIIYDERSGKWEVDLWLRDDGKLIIKDKAFTDVIYGYADLIAIFGSYQIDL